MSKLVVLTGSARKNGNSSAMAQVFLEAAQAKGHTVIRHDAALLNIGGCHGCETCYSTGKPCTFDDDFNRIADDLLTADGIVFAMPVYWYSMPGQIKNVIDKMYSFCVAEKDIKGKKCGLICCCEEGELDVMDGISEPLDRIAALLEWEVVGKVLVPGVLEEGAVDKTDGCEQAAALAEKF